MINHRLHRFKRQIIPNEVTLRSVASGSRRDTKTSTTFGTQIILLATCYLLLATLVYAQPISSKELIDSAADYDGKAVVYEGEVIGDIMRRGEYAWINVRDDTAAIGVWLHKDLTQDILYTGSYKSRGDWLEIKGVFHRACAQHAGELDIHAESVRKIAPGKQTLEALNLRKRNLVFVLLGVLCLVWILRRLKQT